MYTKLLLKTVFWNQLKLYKTYYLVLLHIHLLFVIFRGRYYFYFTFCQSLWLSCMLHIYVDTYLYAKSTDWQKRRKKENKIKIRHQWHTQEHTLIQGSFWNLYTQIMSKIYQAASNTLCAQGLHIRAYCYGCCTYKMYVMYGKEDRRDKKKAFL